MIVNKNRFFIDLLFTLHGSIVPAICHRIILAGLIGVIGVYFEGYYKSFGYDFTPFTVFGIAISLFLGFRNNVCYDRWWEARKHWGKQIIEIRNLSKLLTACSTADTSSAISKILHYAGAHSHALRHQLRSDPAAIIDRDAYLSKDDLEHVAGSPNAADTILQLAAQQLNLLYQHRYIDSILLAALCENLAKLGDVQGSCERIANTPVPFPYSLLIHRTMCLYILLLPLSIVDICGWFTPLIMAIIAYVFFGLDELAHQLENPFSNSVLALPLHSMCRTIDISIAMTLGDEPPPALTPKHDTLM